MTRKRVGLRTHYWMRESEHKFRNWESSVFGGAVFETHLTLTQLESPNTTQNVSLMSSMQGNTKYIFRQSLELAVIAYWPTTIGQ